MTVPYPADLYPGCPCARCDVPTWEVINIGSFDVPMARLSLCPQCGNKRCPGAVDHDRPCSGSNAPGQPDSFYAGDIESPPARCRRCRAVITWTSDRGWKSIFGLTLCPDDNPHLPDADTDLPNPQETT